jgi:hypothetical protein
MQRGAGGCRERREKKRGVRRTMKLCSPSKMFDTLHIGFQLSGWKSDIDRQRRWCVLKRPLVVNI